MVSTTAFHARVRGSFPGLGGLKETKVFTPHPLLKLVGSLRGREVACSASDLKGLKFDVCVWRAVSYHSSPHPQEVLLAQFSLHVHKIGQKPDSSRLIFVVEIKLWLAMHWLKWKDENAITDTFSVTATLCYVGFHLN